MTFGSILFHLRTSRQITQAELAAQLNISKSLISMYERNQRKPSFDILKKISIFFNIDMNTLHGVNSNNQPQNLNTNNYDIQSKIQSLLNDLNDKTAINFYNGGVIMDDETKELLRISLESSIKLAQSRAKHHLDGKNSQ
ncbi:MULTISPECIES: helix-turn-helix transcriptional regulator [unclassified Veillonella]|uniref:helix-turn-helix domain-containing protein n=1 Tax=unclassified Veillonella TaxID=2630086 RepID=UPI0013898611|nr:MULTISPECIES: helix-turn-helix transcriptional regulator [unclassified Veillonella]KAF1682219.1 hypothetical protein VER_06725 [Veillonella sp. R32]